MQQYTQIDSDQTIAQAGEDQVISLAQAGGKSATTPTPAPATRTAAELEEEAEAEEAKERYNTMIEEKVASKKQTA